MGYDHSQDPKKFSTSTLYDKVFQGTNFLEFCEQLLSTDIIYEPFTLTSHGRATIDTAALGIPTVGSNRVESVQRCFPFTSIDPWDAKEANKMLKKLVNDENFRTKVISYAREAVEYYNHKNSTTRFLKALETRSLLLKKQED